MMSYPKSVRLNHRKDFDALLREGATYYNAVFKVYCLVRAAEAGSGSAAELGSVRAGEAGLVCAGEPGSVCAAELGSVRAGEVGSVRAAEAGSVRAAEAGSVCAGEPGSVRASEAGLGAERSGFAPDLSAAEELTATETAQNVAGNRQPAPEGCRFAVSVPKKSFKRAVKRNLLKRRTREAIRLNRAMLPAGFTADFLFFYRSGEVLDYSEIERAVIDAFRSVPQKAAGKCNAGGSDSNLLSEVQSDNGNE